MCRDSVGVGDLHLDSTILGFTGKPQHRAARLLVWLHSTPIGEVELAATAGRVSRERLCQEIWAQLGPAIRAHLDADGLPLPTHLPVQGLPEAEAPVCACARLEARQRSMTVVVATRDRSESLLRTLTSLADLDHDRFDVVVVDSAPSDDRTRQLVEGSGGWPWPLRYVRTSRPGLAIAHNTALPWVSGEAVAFTDDDVVVDQHWLSALAARFADAEVQCVTGLLVPAELETPAQLWVEQGGGYGRGFEMRRYSTSEPDGSALFPFAPGRFGSGANMAFRTEWLVRTGGFDPVTGAGTVARGGDDLVAFASVVLSGGTLVYEPAAVVRHWHRREYQGLRRQAFGYGVGLGAYLAAMLWRDPALAFPMARRVGPALAHVFSRRSDKNSGKRDYPAELTWRERAGMVVGPFAYAVGRWSARRDLVSGSPAP